MKRQEELGKADTDPEFIIDANRREITKHGTEDFPCISYVDQYLNNSYPWHWHDEFEFAYVAKGSLIVSINQQKYTLHEGEGIFINSGVLHAYAGSKDVECLFPNVLVHPSLLYGTQESILWKRYIHPLIEAVSLSHFLFQNQSSWHLEVVDLIKAVFSLLSKKEMGYELRVRNHLSEILCALFDHCTIHESDSITPQNRELNRLRTMLDFIHAQYMDPIQVQQIAEAGSVSKRECIRCFQHVIGTSPKQYVTELRLQKARELLLASSWSLREVSERCGFQDQSYFTKVFREAAGISPGKWRTTYLQKTVGS